jgi:hypothetical protein
MRRPWIPTALLLGGLTACAGRAVTLPTGEGAPFPGYETAWQDATRGCRQVRTLSADLSISGRAGGQRLRGHVLAGVAAPDRIRLEAAAPFGPPLFILAADGSQTTLLLPRDNRVLRGESPAVILDALVGLELRPADLLAILSGCVTPDARAASGRLFPSDWARIDLAGGGAAYLQRDKQAGWFVRAAAREALAITYDPGGGRTPPAVRLLADGTRGSASDLRIVLSQVAIDSTLGPEVFSVRVPADAAPISLKELREAGPLGEKR